MSSPTYQILFSNDSGKAGTVCIFQDVLNAQLPQSTTCKVLAWKVKSVNPVVQVLFQWQIDYDFVWFDYSNALSQQILRVAQPNKAQVPFDKNQYGYFFGEQSASSNSVLSVRQGSNIPTENNTVVGIGMAGSGTFAFDAQPNLTHVFTPVADQSLIFYISFGEYNFATNTVIDPNLLNSPQQFSFPPGVFQLTATINSSNAWEISSGIVELSLFSAETVYNNAS